MQLYDRGIRRRLAPMLGNDRRRLELAYALQFTLRGTPVLRYGEEIGMGEDLSLPGRDAIRTPMQWSYQPNGGFSTRRAGEAGPPGDHRRRVRLREGQRDRAAARPAVAARLVRADDPHAAGGPGGRRRRLHRTSTCRCRAGVLAHRADGPTGRWCSCTTSAPTTAVVDLSTLAAEADQPNDVLADQDYPEPASSTAVDSAGYGYRWIRLRRLT